MERYTAFLIKNLPRKVSDEYERLLRGMVQDRKDHANAVLDHNAFHKITEDLKDQIESVARTAQQKAWEEYREMRQANSSETGSGKGKRRKRDSPGIDAEVAAANILEASESTETAENNLLLSFFGSGDAISRHSSSDAPTFDITGPCQQPGDDSDSLYRWEGSANDLSFFKAFEEFDGVIPLDFSTSNLPENGSDSLVDQDS
jgi:hypothetical protein